MNKQYTTYRAIKPSCSEPNQTGWDCSSSPHSGRGRALPFTTSSPLNTFEPQIRSSSRHTHIQPQPPLIRDRLLCLQALLSTFSCISLYSFQGQNPPCWRCSEKGEWFQRPSVYPLCIKMLPRLKVYSTASFWKEIFNVLVWRIFSRILGICLLSSFPFTVIFSYEWRLSSSLFLELH